MARWISPPCCNADSIPIIGGPMHGRAIPYGGDRFDVPHQPPPVMPLKDPSFDQPDSLLIPKHLYRLELIEVPTGGRSTDHFGIFIHESLTFSQAMARLLNDFAGVWTVIAPKDFSLDPFKEAQENDNDSDVAG